MLRRTAPAILIASALTACAAPKAAADAGVDGRPQALRMEALTIHTARGVRRFTVQVADTEETRETGLMFVRRMPDDRGMVFKFPQAGEQAFWMRNTFIPLDIIYVGPDGRIISIAKRAKPQDETPLPSHGAANGVLEINGGLSDKLGIAVGDKVSDAAIYPPG